MDNIKLKRTIKFQDLNEHCKYVITKICKDLSDLTFYIEEGNKVVDYDFTFIDSEEVFSVNEFEEATETHNNLLTVIDIVMACENLTY
jgi:hypothetical protein